MIINAMSMLKSFRYTLMNMLKYSSCMHIPYRSCSIALFFYQTQEVTTAN